MKDADKTREQLVNELAELRRQISQLETSEVERVQTEKSPPLLDESYQRLLEPFPIGVTVLDMKGMIVHCNPAVCMKSGYSKDDFVGKHFSKVSALRAGDIPKFIKVFASLIRGKMPKAFEVMYTRKDGTTGWTELSINLVKMGRKRRILVMQHDITERKKVEKLLKQSEESLKAYLESAPDGIYINDLKGTFLYGNKKAEEILGYKRQELLGKSFLKLNFLPAKYLAKAGKLLALNAMGRSTGPDEFELITSDGSRVWVEINTTPIKQAEEKVVVIGFVRDITERKRAEETLKESEDRYRNLVENLSDVIYAVDENGVVTYVSPVAELVLGYTPLEIMGRPFADFMHQEDLPPAAGGFQSVLSGHATTGEYRLLNKSGESRWLRTSNQPILKGNRVIGARGVLTDITERKRAEAKLKESEEKLRLMFESVTDGIAVTDMNGVITDVNDRVLEMHGYSSKDRLLGKTAFEFIAPLDHERATANMQKTLEEGSVKDIEYTLLKADGSHFPGELSVSVLKDRSGNPVGFIAITRDITERKQAEEALRESENKFRLLFNRVFDAIVMVDEKGQIVDVNETACRLLGRSKKELWKLSVGDIHPKKEMEKIQVAIARVFRNGIDYMGETAFIDKDGQIIPVEAGGVALDIGGKTHIIGSFRNITERKRAEERERQLQQELYLSSRLAAIGQLAAGVAHEINNPLTGIMGYSELLLRKPTDENTRKGLEIIHSSSLRVSKIVQNLLTFARRHKPKKECVDINEIVKEALELRAYELKTGNIEVALDLASDLPPIMGDFHQLQEVFLNLILNAEQAMSEAHRGGKLIIKTKQLKNRVRISFADDGPGIPSEYLDKLFDPFFSTREEKGGTGLGLSICHGIATEHGGRIYAKSNLGKGSTFFVELPLTT